MELLQDTQRRPTRARGALVGATGGGREVRIGDLAGDPQANVSNSRVAGLRSKSSWANRPIRSITEQAAQLSARRGRLGRRVLLVKRSQSRLRSGAGLTLNGPGPPRMSSSRSNAP